MANCHIPDRIGFLNCALFAFPECDTFQNPHCLPCHSTPRYVAVDGLPCVFLIVPQVPGFVKNFFRFFRNCDFSEPISNFQGGPIWSLCQWSPFRALLDCTGIISHIPGFVKRKFLSPVLDGLHGASVCFAVRLSSLRYALQFLPPLPVFPLSH